MQITLRKAREISLALAKLNGVQQRVSRKGQDDATVLIPFNFKGATRWKIISNAELIAVEEERFNKLRIEAIKEISGGDAIDTKNEVQLSTFFQRMTDLETTPREIALEQFTQDELNLDENQIDLGALLALKTIVK